MIVTLKEANYYNIDSIVEIEQKVFEFNWTKKEFIKYFHSNNCKFIIAESQERLCGYLIYEFVNNKVEILNLAVNPSYLRKGIGTRLINYIKDFVDCDICAYVRETNLISQLFMKRNDFKCIEVVSNHYSDTDELAYFFLCNREI